MKSISDKPRRIRIRRKDRIADEHEQLKAKIREEVEREVAARTLPPREIGANYAAGYAPDPRSDLPPFRYHVRVEGSTLRAIPRAGTSFVIPSIMLERDELVYSAETRWTLAIRYALRNTNAKTKSFGMDVVQYTPSSREYVLAQLAMHALLELEGELDPRYLLFCILYFLLDADVAVDKFLIEIATPLDRYHWWDARGDMAEHMLREVLALKDHVTARPR